MKDIYKNPLVYYVLIPVTVALWPLLVRGVYLPGAESSWQAERVQYTKAQEVMTEILSLDPDRLDFAGLEKGDAEFDYASAVDRVANICQIPSADYKLSSGRITETKKQKSQSAKINLKKVSIRKFASFFSTIQLHWGKLQCVRVKLTKKKDLADAWDVDMDFKYYY